MYCFLASCRSAVRIARKKDGIVQNAQFIRANLVDVWRLALEHRWVVKKQYVLYPNPYPKKTDLKVSRRESFPKPIAGTISFWSLACTEALAWPRVLPSTATDRRRA
mmetsp:Transcript_15889/g.64963  ORF Transcript_15889/g.64963 Transcript_15889/m.64963 type:complete len:107 (+) Transcript_15889:836-1156(+)